VQQLIRAESQNLDDFRVQSIEGALRERGDQVIERSPPPLNTGRNLGRQRAVALVM
jgi:hypothetical protein